MNVLTTSNKVIYLRAGPSPKSTRPYQRAAALNPVVTPFRGNKGFGIQLIPLKVHLSEVYTTSLVTDHTSAARWATALAELKVYGRLEDMRYPSDCLKRTGQASQQRETVQQYYSLDAAAKVCTPWSLKVQQIVNTAYPENTVHRPLSEGTTLQSNPAWLELSAATTEMPRSQIQRAWGKFIYI
jgi:hypothetical protein